MHSNSTHLAFVHRRIILPQTKTAETKSENIRVFGLFHRKSVRKVFEMFRRWSGKRKRETVRQIASTSPITVLRSDYESVFRCLSRNPFASASPACLIQAQSVISESKQSSQISFCSKRGSISSVSTLELLGWLAGCLSIYLCDSIPRQKTTISNSHGVRFSLSEGVRPKSPVSLALTHSLPAPARELPLAKSTFEKISEPLTQPLEPIGV